MSLDTADFVIDELSSSTSLKTLVSESVSSAASSVAVTSPIGFPTTGASSTALTVTVKTSSTVSPPESAVTVIVAVPVWLAS